MVGAKRAIALSYILAVCLSGCTYITHYNELMLLKRFGDNQSEIEKCLGTQEKLFYKLRDDLLNNRLAKGLQNKRILSMYGEPVFCRSLESKDEIKQTCLYRHPTHYFSSDMIYLNFDINQCLDSWELIVKADGLP